MGKILVAAAAVGMFAAFSLAPQHAQARSCQSLAVTAHGATQVTVGAATSIPLWASWIACIVTAGLAWLGFGASRA